MVAWWMPISLGVAVAAPELVGHWEGAYVRNGAVQTVQVDLQVVDDVLLGTCDVPDLGVHGAPVTDIEVSLPNLLWRPKYGKFAMRVHPELGEMTGTNNDWNPPVTLHLKRTLPTPAPPWPAEEVTFGDGRSGTLLLPLDRPGPVAAVVVVAGSGEVRRDTDHYRFWGQFFARHGTAALIWDKRPQPHTFDDLADDVVAAVQWLDTRDDIDRIGLFGISQGGWIAPLAASRTDAVDFVMLNVAPAVTVREQELHRVAYAMRAEEAEEEVIADAVAYTELVFRVAYDRRGLARLVRTAATAKQAPWATYVQIIEADEDIEGWRRIRYDPAPALRQLTVPTLALFGELDRLVPPAENEARLAHYLTEAGNQDATMVVIPGVGHDMEPFGTLHGGAWTWPDAFWVWPRKSQLFYDTILSWMAQRDLR